MATKNINTRIALKIDTLTKWNASTVILMPGEVAIATASASLGNGASEPVTIIKIGDGTHKFSELANSLYANALDVLTACKSEEALTAFVNNVISNAGLATDTAISALNGKVTSLEGLVGNTAVATQIQNAINDLDLANTYEAKGAAEAAKTDIIGTDSDISDKNTIYGAKAYAKAQADGKDAAIAAAKKAGDDAQVAVDALSGKVGEVPEDKTVVQMISEAKATADADHNSLYNSIATVDDKVTTLVGSDTNKSARTIASEEVAKIVAGADESYDTLKEIADWISSHKTDATAMNSAITTLEAIVDGIGGEGEKATVVKYVTDAINALKIGDYAKAADLTALAGRVTTLEGTSHTHTNKSVLDGITSDKISSWDTAATKAGTALQEITTTANGGLKVTNKNQIDIDDSMIFIFNCGTSTTILEG